MAAQIFYEGVEVRRLIKSLKSRIAKLIVNRFLTDTRIAENSDRQKFFLMRLNFCLSMESMAIISSLAVEVVAR